MIEEHWYKAINYFHEEFIQEEKKENIKHWIRAINYFYDEYLIRKEPEQGWKKLLSVLEFLNPFFPCREVLHIIGEDLIIEKRYLFSRSFHRVNPQKTLQPYCFFQEQGASQ